MGSIHMTFIKLTIEYTPKNYTIVAIAAIPLFFETLKC